jgi:hypothetical protein
MKSKFAFPLSFALFSLSIAAGCGAGTTDGNKPSEVSAERAAIDSSTVCPGIWAYQAYTSPCYNYAPSWDCPGSSHRTCTQYQTCADPSFGVKDYTSKQGSFVMKGAPDVECSTGDDLGGRGPRTKPICTRTCDFSDADPASQAEGLMNRWGGTSYSTPACGGGSYPTCSSTCTTNITIPEYNSKAASPCPSSQVECGTELSCRIVGNGTDSNPHDCGTQGWQFTSTTGMSYSDLVAQFPAGLADAYCTTPIAGHANVAAVKTVYDANDHAFVALTGGDIREIWYQAEQATVGNASISNHPDVVAIAAFNALEPSGGASVDRVHVIVATQSGDLYDVYYQPYMGVHEYQLGHVDTGGSPIVAMSAWADAAGAPTYQTVAILAQNGNLYALSYTDVMPLPMAQPPTLVTQTTATALTGYAAEGVNHLVMLDGDLVDISWSVGRAPDLNDTMTQVNTVRGADDTLASVIGIAGVGMSSPTAFSPNGNDHLALLLGGTTPKLSELVFSRGVAASPLVDAATVSGTPVSVAAYLANGDTTQHFVTLADQGALVDYRQTTSSGTWMVYRLGTF